MGSLNLEEVIAASIAMPPPMSELSLERRGFLHARRSPSVTNAGRPSGQTTRRDPEIATWGDPKQSSGPGRPASPTDWAVPRSAGALGVRLREIRDRRSSGRRRRGGDRRPFLIIVIVIHTRDVIGFVGARRVGPAAGKHAKRRTNRDQGAIGVVFGGAETTDDPQENDEYRRDPPTRLHGFRCYHVEERVELTTETTSQDVSAPTQSSACCRLRNVPCTRSRPRR